MIQYPCRNAKIGPQKEQVSVAPTAQQLLFQVPEEFGTCVSSAVTRFDADVARHDHKVLAYDGFGKGIIKKFGMSPDSFVQLSIQLAFYKLFGEPRATYESSQTKKYAWGRTEVCRSVSTDSVSWTEAMLQTDVSPLKKAELARKAAETHSKYIAGAAKGYGVDRHLLGMSL